MFLPWASSARAFCNTSKADSIPMRVIPSANFMALPTIHLTCRLDPDERGVVLLSQDVQVAIGPLSHVADSLTELAQHRLAADLFPPVVEFDSIDLPGPRTLALTQTADEHVAL